MISFGQLKNSMQLLKKYLVKMQFFSIVGQKITIKQIQQSNLRREGNQLFLPLINFIMVEYSTELFVKILEISPNIKYLTDNQFIEQIFVIARKILLMNVNLTVDQFLTNKYFEKKVQFISNLAQKVYQWHFVNQKKSKDIQNILKTQPENRNMYYANQNDDEQQQQEQPRAIKARPIELDSPATNFNQLITTVPMNNKKINNMKKIPLQKMDSDSDNENIGIVSNKNVIKNNQMQNKGKLTNSKPKKQIQNLHQKDQEQQIFKKYLLDSTKNKIPQRPEQEPKKLINKQCEQESDSSQEPQYATKQEANQLLTFMKEISGTINELSTKFQKFQKQVNSEIKNINAKMMMLESNVQMIKQNL